MRKFVLIEHSLQNLGGHYYTYAFSVLQAAEAVGYRPVLVTHHSFRDRQAVPDHWEVHALFPDKSRWTLSPDAVKRGPLSSIRTKLAAGIRSVNRRRIANRFAGAMKRLFERLHLETGDHVFLASVSDADLLGLALFLQSNDATQCAIWHAQFHHSLFHGREPDLPKQTFVAQQARAAFKDALERIPNHRVRLYCTTPQLARQYGYLGVGSFSCLPYAIHSLFRGTRERDALQPVRIACLGHTRMEKGYDQLPQVIRGLWPKYLGTGRAELMLQTRRSELRNKLDQLARELGTSSNHRGLTYAPFPLDLPAYAQLVRSADINLLLYDSTQYYSRCSGVLLESLIAGVPVIIPAGGWLAEQIDERNQIYFESLATQHTAPPMAIGNVQCSDVPATTYVDVPTNAQQALLTFHWRAPKAPGTYLRITARQRTRDGRQTEFAVIVSARDTGPTRTLFDLLPHGERLELVWENAYADGPIEVADAQLTTSNVRHPLGGIGLTAANPQQAQRLVEEILENLDHYQRAAQAACASYAAHYSAEAVVAICTERSLSPANA